MIQSIILGIDGLWLLVLAYGWWKLRRDLREVEALLGLVLRHPAPEDQRSKPFE